MVYETSFIKITSTKKKKTWILFLLKFQYIYVHTLECFLQRLVFDIAIYNVSILCKIFQYIKIFFSVYVTYKTLLFNASKNNLNKTFKFVLLCLPFWPWAGSHVNQIYCCINCFIFRSLDSDQNDCSDDSGKQLNAIDTQLIQYNRNSLNFWNFKLEKYIKIFPGLTYHSVEKGYKCKTCQLLPSAGSGGQSQHKFGKAAAESLTDHPNVCFMAMRLLKSISMQ